MNNSLSYLANDLFLRQSELFGQEYSMFEIKQIHTFNDITISNLDDWYNSILIKYSLTEDLQIETFGKFTNSLNKFLNRLDPIKIEGIKDLFIDEENDFLLWRESELGVSKLIFDTYGEITYNFNGFDGKMQRGVFNTDADMEKLMFRFFKL